jgi:hypothetical protein
VSITIEPKTVGSAMSTDVAAFIARSYLMARKQIPKNANFQLWASCEFDSMDTRTDYGSDSRTVTTTKYDNNNLGKFFDDFKNQNN